MLLFSSVLSARTDVEAQSIFRTATSVHQDALSPEAFLGYPLGSRFTPHHRLLAYAEHLAACSDRVSLVHYGESYEHRPLIALFISSAKNMAQLETIRTDNLKRAGLMAGQPITEIPIAWFSYNVHGNEAVGVETAMLTLWHLVDAQDEETLNWLRETVVVIDPCLNPDGHSRYVHWYNQKANRQLQPDPQSIEHIEPWPGGRPNHYLFDLNRDWAWQTQQESQHRSALYQQWMPHIHVDFHEQGIDYPYFFAPAAEPVHEYVTAFQREFQSVVGHHMAQAFDRRGWLYFTREVFDLFYPSYGDTWPTFNGAIGMTYEQGGSGRAGLAVQTGLGDTLTLYERMIHHYTAGLSTIAVVHAHRHRLLKEFEHYFADHATNPKGKYKTYVLKPGEVPSRLVPIETLLRRNDIVYTRTRGPSGRNATLKGYSYATGGQAAFHLEEGDLVISAYQPKSVLVQTLFDPDPLLSDSLTYDITSWAVPYAHGVNAFALEKPLALTAAVAESGVEEETEKREIKVAHVDLQLAGTEQSPLAYVVPWNASVHPRFLAGLLSAGVRARFATQDFRVAENTFNAGSLIIGREGNDTLADLDGLVCDLAQKHDLEPVPVSTGYMELGNDFGSASVRAVTKPRVALIGGQKVSSLNFGEIWFYFEQELGYPLSVIDGDRFAALDLRHYDVLILPSGNYQSWGESGFQKLSTWIAAGGKLIAIEAALGSLRGKPGFGITDYLTDEEQKRAEKIKEEELTAKLLIPYGDRERESLSERFSGAIYSVRVDSTHPLGYGLGDSYYTLKNHATRYAFLKSGVNVGVIRSAEDQRSGFAGAKARRSVGGSLAFGAETHGQGHVIYFVDNPLFRGFWEQGKLLLANALFLVGQ